MTANDLLLDNRLTIGRLLSKNEHVSNMAGRKCQICKEKIIYGTRCITRTYSLIKNPKKLQMSFHIECSDQIID